MTPVVDVLAAIDKNNVNPGALGFVVVALLGVATWLLIRSMHKQLGKVDFDEGPDVEDEVESDRTELDDPDRQH